MSHSEKIHIGTSGWHYDHWKGPFYPDDLSKEDLLEYYAERFHSVEINNSFYQLPKEKTLIKWRDDSPEGFIFAAKASRYITHMKKLKDGDRTVPPFLESITALQDKLGPILFQLPPKWRFNGERLRSFLDTLPSKHRYAFEFRDPSWFNDEAYEILAQYGAAFCIYELAGQVSPREVVGDMIYVRLHGPEGAYQGRYDDHILAEWAQAFLNWAAQEKEVYCFFDNDEAGYAPKDALRIQELIAG